MDTLGLIGTFIFVFLGGIVVGALGASHVIATALSERLDYETAMKVARLLGDKGD
jgi:hypothetical protein